MLYVFSLVLTCAPFRKIYTDFLALPRYMRPWASGRKAPAHTMNSLFFLWESLTVSSKVFDATFYTSRLVPTLELDLVLILGG